MDPSATVENFNETKLKKILINFERKFSDNQKLRIKHAESPTKFASSETELFAALDELQSVATQPELFHVLVAKKTPATLLALLAHENTDISAKVIGMLQECTDVDEAADQESTELLIKALLSENLIELLVSNLDRLDEGIKEESQAINNSLAIIENLIDFNPKLASGEIEPLIRWMINQIKKSNEFNSIKLSIAELLSLLLMNGGSTNKLRFCEVAGIDVLLQQVAYYRRVAPVTGDEHEFLEQIINCLCTAILDCDQNRESFYEEQGVDLVELILKEKREAVRKSNIKSSTLKLFNHVLTTDKNEDPIVSKCCERFIEVLGLRVLFPIFNQPKIVLSQKVKRHEYHSILDEIEEHTVAILLALLKYTQNTDYIQRILVKFADSNFEKLNRLLALHEKFFRLASNLSDLSDTAANGVRDEDDDDDRRAERAKSSVFFTLRTIDYIILLTCYLSNHFETYDPASGETFTNRASKLLSQRPQLRHQIVLETRNHIDEVAASSSEEQNSLELLLEHFGKLGRGKDKCATDSARVDSKCARGDVEDNKDFAGAKEN